MSLVLVAWTLVKCIFTSTPHPVVASIVIVPAIFSLTLSNPFPSNDFFNPLHARAMKFLRQTVLLTTFVWWTMRGIQDSSMPIVIEASIAAVFHACYFRSSSGYFRTMANPNIQAKLFLATVLAASAALLISFSVMEYHILLFLLFQFVFFALVGFGVKNFTTSNFLQRIMPILHDSFVTLSRMVTFVTADSLLRTWLFFKTALYAMLISFFCSSALADGTVRGLAHAPAAIAAIALFLLSAGSALPSQPLVTAGTRLYRGLHCRLWDTLFEASRATAEALAWLLPQMSVLAKTAIVSLAPAIRFVGRALVTVLFRRATMLFSGSLVVLLVAYVVC